MSGGFNFKVNEQQIREHISRKYSESLRTMGIQIPEKLTLMGYGDVEISKNAFFAKDFRPEQVVVVRLGTLTVEFQDPVTYYAIVRCANIGTEHSCTGGIGIEDSRVLFVNDSKLPKSVELIRYNLTKGDTSTVPAIEKRKAVIKKIKDADKYFVNHVWFEVKNSISSTDTYNIFIYNQVLSNRSLLKFFYNLHISIPNPKYEGPFQCLNDYDPNEDEILKNWNAPQQIHEQLRVQQ
jgi:hypothetical protein